MIEGSRKCKYLHVYIYLILFVTRHYCLFNHHSVFKCTCTKLYTCTRTIILLNCRYNFFFITLHENSFHINIFASNLLSSIKIQDGIFLVIIKIIHITINTVSWIKQQKLKSQSFHSLFLCPLMQLQTCKNMNRIWNNPKLNGNKRLN